MNNQILRGFIFLGALFGGDLFCLCIFGHNKAQLAIVIHHQPLLTVQTHNPAGGQNDLASRIAADAVIRLLRRRHGGSAPHIESSRLHRILQRLDGRLIGIGQGQILRLDPGVLLPFIVNLHPARRLLGGQHHIAIFQAADPRRPVRGAVPDIQRTGRYNIQVGGIHRKGQRTGQFKGIFIHAGNLSRSSEAIDCRCHRISKGIGRNRVNDHPDAVNLSRFKGV